MKAPVRLPLLPTARCSRLARKECYQQSTSRPEKNVGVVNTGAKKGWFGAAGSPLVEGGKVLVNIGGIAAYDEEDRQRRMEGHQR